jgi:hypothetical protein
MNIRRNNRNRWTLKYDTFDTFIIDRNNVKDVNELINWLVEHVGPSTKRYIEGDNHVYGKGWQIRRTWKNCENYDIKECYIVSLENEEAVSDGFQKAVILFKLRWL